MAFVATEQSLPTERLFGVQGTALITVQTLAATGDKAAFCGRVRTPNRGSKNITKVGFRFGTVVKAGGSGLTVSLQDVDLANGPPLRPDGTQDQTVAVSNASITTGAWLETGALNATRTVAHGDRLAVVVEFDGSGRLGADSFPINAYGGTASLAFMDGCAVGFTGATWTATLASAGGIILLFDDGTFGTLDGGIPASVAGNDAFNSGSGAPIIGLQFTVPFTCKTDGAWALMQAAANADFNLKLYSVSGSALTLMATSASDANAARAAATIFMHDTIFPEQTLVTGTTYFLALEATTVNNLTLYNYTVNSAAYFGAIHGGTSWVYNTATGTTLGSSTSTKRPIMGLRVSAVDDGTGSGGTSSARMIGG